MRLATRSYVLSLDLRGFAILSSEFDLDGGERSVSATFRHLPATFPRLRCILLDGHPDLDPALLSRPLEPASLQAPQFQPPLMLSIPHCHSQLAATFFASPYLTNLVYLDISDTPGSLKSALAQSTFSPANLPFLRVLKAQGREMDDSTAILLFRSFKEQLWSLDLSRNSLTDAVINDMVHFCFPSRSLRTAAHFDVEGKLDLTMSAGSSAYGPFGFICESEWSRDFTHPDRYMADAPIYTRNAYRPGQEVLSMRHDGLESARGDSAGDIKQALAGTMETSPRDIEEVRRLDVWNSHGGITHLRLNGNAFSAAGVEKLIRSSPGQLRHFECSSAAAQGLKQTLPPWLAKNPRFSAVLGAAHLFRPVISPNLQVLRIHHSLVTQVPTLETDNLVTMANLWLAETFIRERVELAYPQVFVPDMNPRLYSLTLTNIPRYSVGPVVSKLLRLLRLVSMQERAIQDVQLPSSRRSPNTLRGIRHIRLEFEPDPTEELGHSLDSEDLDPEQLINLSSKEFSFFGDLGWGSAPTSDKPQPPSSRHSDTQTEPPPKPRTPDSGRLDHYPSGERQDEYVVDHPVSWNGNDLTVPVWIGTAAPGPHEAVNEYMRLLQDPALRANAAPASPSHIAAGVPAGSYIFYSAWDAMLLRPPHTLRKPTKADIAGMRDVVAAIKAYRGRTRAAFDAAKRAAGSAGPAVRLGVPHYHWTGKLEVSLADTMARDHSSKFWR